MAWDIELGLADVHVAAPPVADHHLLPPPPSPPSQTNHYYNNTINIGNPPLQQQPQSIPPFQQQSRFMPTAVATSLPVERSKSTSLVQQDPFKNLNLVTATPIPTSTQRS